MNRIPTKLLAILVTTAFSSQLVAQTPAWTPFGNADANVATENQSLPDSFGPEKNVIWKTPVMPGSSSPCIWGDRLFLTGFEGDQLAVLCFSRKSGEQLWRSNFTRAGDEKFGHPASSPAAPSTCTDGQRVFAYFGAYGLVALDLEGNLLWEQTYEFKPTQFGQGTSPVLHDDAVYMVRDLDSGSSIHCYDAATGQERWVTPRPEARSNFGTPIIFGDNLVVAGSSMVKAYDLATGDPVWWVGGLTAIACTSPLASDDTIYFGGWSTPNVQPADRLATGFDPGVGGLTEEDLKTVEGIFGRLDSDGDGSLSIEEVPPSRARDGFAMFDFDRSGTWEPRELAGLMSFPTAPGENKLVAVRAGGEGDVTESNIVWQRRKAIPYVATPLLYKDRLYYFKKGGLVSCVDAKTGEAFYESKRLGAPGEYYSTPIGVGERVLVGTQRGLMLVLGTGDELEVIARNDFDEAIVSSPAVVENTLYVRTGAHLYAIGDTSEN